MTLPSAHTDPEHADLERVPGTVFLVDESHQSQAKHARGSNKDVVLVPTPSDDPNDPLNWSARRKNLSAFCMAL